MVLSIRHSTGFGQGTTLRPKQGPVSDARSLLQGAVFEEGIPVTDDPPEQQVLAA